MEGKTPVLMYVKPPLLAEGIISAIMASDDFEVIATPEGEIQMITLNHQLQPRLAILGSNALGTAIFKVVKEIKSANANLSVLVLADKPTLPQLFRCLRCGVTGYLLNTATKEELLSALRAVYAGEVVLDKDVLDDLTQQRSYGTDEQTEFSRLQRLTSRELQTLRLAGKGLTSKDIAAKLFVSERTVQNHFSAIFVKLGVKSRTEAVLQAWRFGLVAEEDLTS